MENGLNFKNKILDNFIPFNDIWYKSCFYHALFPVLNHFNKSIFAILLNEFYVYDYNKLGNDVKLGLVGIYKKTQEELFSDMGIIEGKKIYSNDIICDLKASIDNNHPVVILIDSYYESLRKDAYQKQHIPHSLLIYGYSETEQVFNIIEHSYQNSYLFENRVISFLDIFNSYTGYIESYNSKKDHPTYLEYSTNNPYNNVENNNTEKYISLYIHDLLRQKDDIFCRLEHIKVFHEDYSVIISDEESLKRNVGNMVDILNSITNCKSIERYLLLKVFNQANDSLDSVERVYRNWSFIRGIIARYQFSLHFNRRSLDISADKLLQTYELEYQYYERLFDLFNDWRKN